MAIDIPVTSQSDRSCIKDDIIYTLEIREGNSGLMRGRIRIPMDWGERWFAGPSTSLPGTRTSDVST